MGYLALDIDEVVLTPQVLLRNALLTVWQKWGRHFGGLVVRIWIRIRLGLHFRFAQLYDIHMIIAIHLYTLAKSYAQTQPLESPGKFSKDDLTPMTRWVYGLKMAWHIHRWAHHAIFTTFSRRRWRHVVIATPLNKLGTHLNSDFFCQHGHRLWYEQMRILHLYFRT